MMASSLNQRKSTMIGVNTSTLPPSVPTDQALMGALSLLASLGNAQTTAATLTQMAEHKQAIDDAIVVNNAAAATATEKAGGAQ
jgi:hypothetical protein